MRCNQVQQTLSLSETLSSQASDHLAKCPACRAHREAVSQMESGFASLKRVSAPTFKDISLARPRPGADYSGFVKAGLSVLTLGVVLAATPMLAMQLTKVQPVRIFKPTTYRVMVFNTIQGRGPLQLGQEEVVTPSTVRLKTFDGVGKVFDDSEKSTEDDLKGVSLDTRSLFESAVGTKHIPIRAFLTPWQPEILGKVMLPMNKPLKLEIGQPAPLHLEPEIMVINIATGVAGLEGSQVLPVTLTDKAGMNRLLEYLDPATRRPWLAEVQYMEDGRWHPSWFVSFVDPGIAAKPASS